MMTARAVEIYKVRIPLEAVSKLSVEDRFSYYLLGHLFNELMSLQKIVGFALPKHDDQRPARVRPELAQAMLLFRMASGKLYESVLAIRDKTLSATLRSLILPKMNDGVGRLKAVNAAVSNASWLSPLRNGMAFHAPTLDDWKVHIAPDETWVDDVVYMGRQSGNTFYDAADTVAQAWMFTQYDADVRKAVDPLITEMIDLLGMVNIFLEDCLTIFVEVVMLDEEPSLEPIGKVLSPQHNKVFIPFWTSMPPKKN
jgi:hypothetical protein